MLEHILTNYKRDLALKAFSLKTPETSFRSFVYKNNS